MSEIPTGSLPCLFPLCWQIKCSRQRDLSVLSGFLQTHWCRGYAIRRYLRSHNNITGSLQCNAIVAYFNLWYVWSDQERTWNNKRNHQMSKEREKERNNSNRCKEKCITPSFNRWNSPGLLCLPILPPRPREAWGRRKNTLGHHRGHDTSPSWGEILPRRNTLLLDWRDTWRRDVGEGWGWGAYITFTRVVDPGGGLSSFAVIKGDLLTQLFTVKFIPEKSNTCILPAQTCRRPIVLAPRNRSTIRGVWSAAKRCIYSRMWLLFTNPHENVPRTFNTRPFIM